jgi:Asp-tRNA(Asn)/Glu-tRNA(Gln) amidotransferase A subunit family amidase
MGTETDASILGPSSANNLIGMKPSVGLTSRDLVIPISQHQDTVGPMARSVSDAAYILSIIAGKDGNGNYTLAFGTTIRRSSRLRAVSQFLKSPRSENWDSEEHNPE